MSVMGEQQARSRRIFTDEFERDAVAMVLDEGLRVVDMAARLGIVDGRWGTGCAKPGWTVGGHEIVPGGGHVGARWRPTVLPTGGRQFFPR